MVDVTDRYAADDVIQRVLDDSTTWAFVGLADNPARTVYRMAQAAQAHGKKIVPVHPDAETVLGEQGYPTLADIPFPVDVVGVYRRAEHAGAFADEAIRIGARAVWFPLDVIDESAARRVVEAGLDMVMDRCPAIEWGRR